MLKLSPTKLADHEPSTDEFRRDVVRGLRMQPKRLRSKYFYDERGSGLFDEICELDEYYLTRAELEITERYAAEFARTDRRGCSAGGVRQREQREDPDSARSPGESDRVRPGRHLPSASAQDGQ